MVNFFRFQWLCLKEAWRGCWTRANEKGAVLGGGVLALLLFLLRGWLSLMNWIEAPTTIWGNAIFAFALTVGSLCLSFSVLFLGRLALAPARLYWAQHKRADGLQAELSAATAKCDNGPDWPIHELFFYLEPEALDRPKDSLWEKAGNAIRDALSLGRLKVWGRPCVTHLGEWVGEPAALRHIESNYWEKAYFTYSFFDDSAGDAPQTYADRDTGRPAYTDLQVNRAEVLKVWPGEPDDLAEGYANVRVADSPAVLELFSGRDRTKLIGLLISNKLTTWARHSAGIAGDLMPVEGKIWSTHSFQFIPRRDGDSDTINQSYLRPRFTPNSSHYDVCLNYAQLKRAWPQLQIRRTACDIR
jgi:hypothetical protein